MEKAKITECNSEYTWYQDKIGEEFPYIRAEAQHNRYVVLNPADGTECFVGWNDAFLFDDEYQLDQKLNFHEAMVALDKGWSVRIYHPKLTRNIGLNKRMGCRHLMDVLNHEEFFNFTFQDLFNAEWKIIDKEF